MLIADGELRAYLDGEVDPARQAEIEQALAADPALARRLDAVRASQAWAAGALGSLGYSGPPVDAQAALASISVGAKAPQRHPRAWGALAASLLLGALLLGWQPARAMAQRMLGFLRFESVAVLELDRRMLRNPNLSNTQAQMFAQALSDSVQQIKKAGPQRTPESRQQASEWANFNVRLPAGRIDAPALTVTDSEALEMTVDIVRVERLIDIIGGSDVEIPQRLDQAHVRVDVFESVRARYGECWVEGEKLAPGCFQLVQTRTPSVVTTPEIDLEEIARLGLEVAGISREEAAMMTSAIDWTSTLVIPMPEDQATHQEVDVDGAQGVLIAFQPSDGGLQRYGIVWVKRGVTYMLHSVGDTGLGLQMANSLE